MNDRASRDGSLIAAERIERSILLIRGHKVILDADLSALYGVETKQLIRAVKRNLLRFPEDFMFQLNEEEFENLRFHFGTSSQKSEWSEQRPSNRFLMDDLKATFKKWRRIGWKNVCKLWLQERTPEELKGEGR